MFFFSYSINVCESRKAGFFFSYSINICEKTKPYLSNADPDFSEVLDPDPAVLEGRFRIRGATRRLDPDPI